MAFEKMLNFFKPDTIAAEEPENEKPKPLPEYRRKDDETAEREISETVDADGIAEKITMDFSIGTEGADIIKALARLVFELKDRLAYYDTILSDDASGHILSLILRDVIKKKKESLGQKGPQTFFIACGRHESKKFESKVEEFVISKKKNMGRALLVTEYIDSGRSITSVVKMLEKNNIDFDVASLSAEYRLNGEGYRKELKRHLIVGEDGSNTGLGFYSTGFTGVKKGKKPSAHPIIDGDDKREDVVNARKDAKLIAEELYKLTE
ncbi:MAG: hypothetical protein V1867_07665 [Candidatus Falkowbacteria bacterium]